MRCGSIVTVVLGLFDCSPSLLTPKKIASFIFKTHSVLMYKKRIFFPRFNFVLFRQVIVLFSNIRDSSAHH